MAKKTSIKGSFNKYILQAEKRAVASKGTKAIRKHAATAWNWPETIVQSLRLGHDGKTPLIIHKTAVEEQIKDLEYGTADSRPAPALRSFTWGDR